MVCKHCKNQVCDVDGRGMEEEEGERQNWGRGGGADGTWDLRELASGFAMAGQ